jgi:hypothetical protein
MHSKKAVPGLCVDYPYFIKRVRNCVKPSGYLHIAEPTYYDILTKPKTCRLKE